MPTVQGKVTKLYKNPKDGERGPYTNYKAYIEGNSYSTNSTEQGEKLAEGAFVIAEYNVAGNEGQWRNLTSVIVQGESTEGHKDDVDPSNYPTATGNRPATGQQDNPQRRGMIFNQANEWARLRLAVDADNPAIEQEIATMFKVCERALLKIEGGGIDFAKLNAELNADTPSETAEQGGAPTSADDDPYEKDLPW